MNRTDELTDRQIDGTLTDAETVELELLLGADLSAQARHLAAVRLEWVLRGLRTEFDFASEAIARIESDRVERTTHAVMAELARHPAPGRQRPVRRLRVAAAFVALAGALLVAVWFGIQSADAPIQPGDPSHPEFARLTSVSGFVEVVGPAGETDARPDQLLTADQTLRTVGEESVAVVELPDRSRVEIHPESLVRFGAEPAGELARKLFLIQGRITVVANGGRLVVGAGATEVKASRGSFSLWSAGSGSARVESTAGDVQVRNGAPVEPVRLDPGHAAYVRDERTPMRIDARWRIDSEPRARLDFQALDVGFTPEGEVLAVSAKQWTHWKPGAPDPGRTLFPPKVFNDGLASWLTPDRRSVALCRIDDREERIVVRELPSGIERGWIPVRVNEPRFLCIAPDAKWVTTVGQKPNNRRVRVWDVATGKDRFAFDLDGTVTGLAASPAGRALAVGVSDLAKDSGNCIVVFDTTDGKRTFDLRTRRKSMTALGFSADGKHLAAGFNGAVQVWSVPDRKLVQTLEGFERSVARVAFDPTGTLLAAGMGDGQVWVWSTATGRRTQVIETGTRGVRSLAFSPDGTLLVTATNKTPVAVWDVAPRPAKIEPDA